jgi:hypothetical protein
MTTTWKNGDRVKWHASQGTVHGTVEATLTEETQIGGHRVAASPDAPQLLVKSTKTGATAAHRPDALERDES